jgi:DNA-binding SARP family transcriptional activator/tetratricopeptide (TPR) repeat protein
VAALVATVVERAVRFRILGPIEVVGDDGRRIGLEGRRARALLAVLLVHRDQLVSDDQLIDVLWGDAPPAQAKGSLQAYVSKVRNVIGSHGGLNGGERIVRRPPGYQLITLGGELDADLLERILARGEGAIREGRFAVASASLTEALRLIRGPLLGECRDEPFAQGEVARLEAIVLRVHERRIDAELAVGASTIIGELEALVSDHPLHERFHEQLMLALYRSGRQVEALQVYQRARRFLDDELGLLPGPGLRSMEAAILAHDPSLNARTERTSPRVETRSGELPFVGRERERRVLDTAWQRAAAGESQFVVIEAEPGMGATRLATELATTAAEAGAVVLVGRAASESAVPYLPFIEAFASLEDHPVSVPSSGAQGADLLPAAAGAASTLDPRGHDSSSRRYLLFEAVVARLRSVASGAGAVLILDDVHVADPSALQLLEHVARHRAKGRLLIIATADSTRLRASPAGAVLSGLVADGIATRVTPGGLSEGEVGELLALAAGRSDGVLPGLIAVVHELTMGVPLFVAELGKSLADLDDRAVQAGADLPMSERIKATLERRIDAVPPAVVAVLRTAAVIGMAFDAETVAALSRQTVASLAGHLDTASAAGLIREESLPGRYRFAHRMLHRAFDERVGPTARGELHGELANILTGPSAPRGTTPAEVAHHFKRAALHHARQAVTYAIRAGDQAMAVFAFEDAANFYGSALETLRSFGSTDLRVELQVVLALGYAHHAAYQRTDAVVGFRQAVQLALDVGDGAALADAVWGLMISTEFSFTDGEAIDLLRRAAATTHGLDAPPRARLLAGLARVLPPGDPEASGLIDDAIGLARRDRDPPTLASVLAAAVLTTWSPDNLEWREATTDEVIAVAEQLGWIELAMEAMNWRSAMHEESGRMGRADDDLAMVEDWSVRSRRPFFRALIAMRRASRALMEGRYGDAEIHADVMLAAAGDNPDFLSGYGAQLLLVRRDQGRLTELDSLVKGQITAFPNIPAWRVAGALIDAALDRREGAGRQLDELVRDDLVTLPRDWLWLLTVTLLADVCADLAVRDVPGGRGAGTVTTLVRALTAFEGHVAVLGHGIAVTGAVSGSLGRLEAVLGQWARAEGHFRSAIALNEQIHARPAQLRAEVGYAEMLLARAGPGDAAEASRLLEHAMEGADSLGMRGLQLPVGRRGTRSPAKRTP